MNAFEKIVIKLDTRLGAPMGRCNVGQRPTNINNKVFDRRVRLCAGGYDAGNAYWGLGSELRVSYTKDLSYIEFYRI
jgi:hypothetical protein